MLIFNIKSLTVPYYLFSKLQYGQQLDTENASRLEHLNIYI